MSRDLDEAASEVEGLGRTGAEVPVDEQAAMALGAQLVGEQGQRPIADATPLVAAVDEQPPQVRLRMVGGRLGENEEPDQPAVGLDRPQPGHDRRPVDDVGEQRVGVGLGHP